MLFNRFKKWFNSNWHFAGIILFFILHGYSENQLLIPFTSLLLLLLELLAAGLILNWISRKIFRTPQKAGLFTSLTLVIVLFFGAFQDFFSGFRLTAPISRLAIFFPISLFVLLLLFLWLKRSKKIFNRLVVFINVLVWLYIAIDIVVIAVQFIIPQNRTEKNNGKFSVAVCDTCNKPPVYLILLDEYVGFDGAQEYFQYSNASFAGFLQQQGFHIVQHTNSNYWHTIFSMASMLNMDYHHNWGPILMQNHYAYKKAVAAIRNNQVCAVFETQGYNIINHSGFDITGAPAGYSSELPDKIRLVTNQTMYYRVIKNLLVTLAEGNKWPLLRAKLENDYIHNNQNAIKQTLSEATHKEVIPKFTYVHLMMPHEPFSFDSSGNRTTSFWKLKGVGYTNKKKAYLQYLVYTNKKIAEFITELKKLTGGKAVIVLMSDHGLRMVTTEDEKLNFQNLSAVYLPKGNYSSWYDGMTNVNQFRVLFNTLFNSQLPMLKDSLVYR